MKNLILFLMMAGLLVACQNNKPARYSQSGAEIDLVKSLVSDYENGNWESWKTHYGDTAKIFHNTKDNGLSPDEAMKVMKANLEGIASYGFLDDEGDMERVIDDKGRTWVNFWGNWKGVIAANNREIVTPVHVTVQIVDSLIVREYGYWDNAPMMQAMMEIEAAAKAAEAETQE